jgi:hypothetical protein
MKPWNRCDDCGQFIPFSDFEDGHASRKLLTPDSHFSREEYETLCRRRAAQASPWTNKRTCLGMCLAAAVAGAVGLFLVGVG